MKRLKRFKVKKYMSRSINTYITYTYAHTCLKYVHEKEKDREKDGEKDRRSRANPNQERRQRGAKKSIT